MKKTLFIFFVFFFTLHAASASIIDGTVSASPAYAFGSKLGWVNFGCTNCNVHVTDTKLTGFTWSRQYGWINLAPTGGGVTNNCAGDLGGKAWSDSLGWVDFSGASIDASGKFLGVAGTPATKAGVLNFSCTNCGITTDWLQCALRSSPAQVVINSMTNTTAPTATANVTITNEGLIDTEYQYEWCVVSDINNACGGGDDVFYSSGAKLITAGNSWTTSLSGTVSNPGSYYFKLVVHFGLNFSSASRFFTEVAAGGGGGGGGGGGLPSVSGDYSSADFNRDHVVNSADFSILLFYWKQSPPFKNIYVDINKDGKVNSTEFSIMLSQWGKRTI